jgi:hypothetical protein
MNQPQGRNWWDRNWKWFVPVGCLGSLILFLGFIAAIMLLVFGMMKSSGAYKNGSRSRFFVHSSRFSRHLERFSRKFPAKPPRFYIFKTLNFHCQIPFFNRQP